MFAKARAPLTAGPHSNPKSIPVMPPARLRTLVSTKNWRIMSRLFAPSARRIPISRVLSVTVASMMFIMPIPPTNSEIAAIIPMNNINIARVVLACSSNSKGTTTEMSSIFSWVDNADSTKSAVRLTSETSATRNVIWFSSMISPSREPERLTITISPMR